MQADDPPYLSVGTAVSAKYKGAFCEAKVSKIDRMVKCKVTFKSGLGSAVVSDNEIKGTLRVGQQVQVRHSESKDLVEATVTKIQDCSQYTVVFDDGDITSLRRTALCLKSGRHFNESETLDQLPLTHPEHFGIPVIGGRRGRRNRLLNDVFRDGSSDEEIEEEAEPDLEGYTQDIGRVVSVDTGETKRGREKWFPGLIVIPSAQLTVKINVKDEFLIRSFRDDRYYTVPKKEVNEFTRDLAEKIDSAGLAEAIQKAIKFLDTNELPLHWEKNSLFNSGDASDSDDNGSDTSDDEQSEEKDHFVAQLYKYMDDSGTPLNKTPTISGRDIDLHRLFRVVDKMGGYNRVTNQNKWKSVAAKMRLSVNQNVANQVKAVYKKCLLSYEGFFRTLGVTMSIPTRLNKKDKGRSLIRDKDRTPISSPRPDREDEQEKPIERKTPILKEEKPELKTKRRSEVKDLSAKKAKPEPRDVSSDVSDTPSTSSTRSKRLENKIKAKSGPSESKEEVFKKEEKVQITRSKSLTSLKPKEMVTTRQSKEIKNVKVIKEPTKEEKKPKTKKKLDLDEPPQTANIGDKLIVYYGPTNESKVTYEAKVVDMDKDQTGPIYLVHYTGWNTRYDEWIPALRIAENLSAGTKTKRCKIPAPVNVKPSTSGVKPPVKRSRLASISSKGPADDKPRSTTPSSVISGGSSKSPANVGTRSIRLAAKKENMRRTSAQTDISVASESESESSESEPELPRTRSGSIKPDENELKTYKRRLSKPSPKLPRRKDPSREDDDTEKEEEPEKLPREKRITRKPKKLSDKSTEESEDDEESRSSLPKGRDFDLNQIRSELKGFSKPISTVANVDVDKEVYSSEDSEITEIVRDEKQEDLVDIEKEETPEEVPKPKTPPPKLLSPKLETSLSSDDIYEFKEPEPFEFESRSKLVDDKNPKKRPRIFDSLEDRSPRKKSVSPEKSEKLPEPRTYSRIPKKIQISDDEDTMESLGMDVKEDPFDKLIESASFNFDCEKSESKETLFVEATFKENPETTSDECSRDVELSDCDSQQPEITRDESPSPNTSHSKSPVEIDSNDKTEEAKNPISEDEDFQTQIQLAIARSASPNEDSNEMIVTPKSKSPEPYASPKNSEKDTKSEPSSPPSPKKSIDPALQETDSSLLELIVSKPPLILNPKLDETVKELSVKTGTKIADSILEKFNFIKKNIEVEIEEPEVLPTKVEEEEKEVQSEVKPVEDELSEDHQKSKSVLDESDDSSGSENLVIGSDDEEFPSNVEEEKIEPKPTILDDAQIFNTDDKASIDPQPVEKEELVTENEPINEPKEEQDPGLHSLLLCEEEIPRSPAPVLEIPITSDIVAGSVHEIPFASAPGTSNSKMLIEPKKPTLLDIPAERENREVAVLDNSPPSTPESTISNLSPRGDNGNDSPNSNDSKSNEAEPNLEEPKPIIGPIKVSPYDEEDTQPGPDLPSPRKIDSFGPPSVYRKRRRSLRNSEDGSSGLPPVPAKRGRKPRQRRDSDSDDASENSMISGRNTPGNSSVYDRSARSPRPSKYNFFVEFDPNLDSTQRIQLLQQKLSEIRKTYADVKAELATVERRRKRIRRREREALKNAKQEVVCA